MRRAFTSATVVALLKCELARARHAPFAAALIVAMRASSFTRSCVVNADAAKVGGRRSTQCAAAVGRCGSAVTAATWVSTLVEFLKNAVPSTCE